MKRLLLIAVASALFNINVFAHEPFALVSSQKKTITRAELADVEKSSGGSIRNNDIVFEGSEARIVVVTGPEDDMLSYRIQGVRNPNIVVPAGATLKILFINVDGDMRHDMRFGHILGDFTIDPGIAETAGTERLTPMSDESIYHAEEIVLRTEDNGAYKYFCSVRGHAKGGMWGNIFVGTKPDADTQMPEKTVHKHSPDEDNMQNMPGMDMTAGKTMRMSSVVNIADPMSREGSGTSWLPESSPTYARMKMFSDGSMLMFHGTAFLRYTSIGSDRDVSIAGKGSRSRFDAPSTFMLMYSKPLGKRSQLGLRAMFSLDPLVERGFGYPLLFQSGESYRDEPLHDRQHPHDFISELAATYSYKINEKNSVYFYAGYPGEPALGPVMYLHRPSGMNNPDAPIGHHWQDSSHISFGVLTAGYTYEKLKFEVSAFNGTEPDENRWAFDSPKLNSFSARLSFNPTKEWSFQISHGYLRNPEKMEPEIRILRRTTASAMYNKSFSDQRNWSNSFVWGQNYSVDGRTNAFLLESNYEFWKNSIFGRAEQVQKSAHELVLPSPHPEGNIWVQSYSVGYLRDVIKDKGIDVGIGGMFTAGFNPSAISSFYGGTRHGGWQIFVRLRPSRIKH